AHAANDSALLEAFDDVPDGQPAKTRIGSGRQRIGWLLRGDHGLLCSNCLTARKRQQFAHYPFRSSELKRPLVTKPEAKLLRHARDDLPRRIVGRLGAFRACARACGSAVVGTRRLRRISRLSDRGWRGSRRLTRSFVA